MGHDVVRCNIIGKVEEVTVAANTIWPNLYMPQPTIGWFHTTTTAGKAYYLQHKVTFNEVIARNNFSKFDQTVIHEVAHLVTKRLYPSAKPHGREWKYVMHCLGGKPERCHRYDVTEIKAQRAKRVPSRKYVYTCACNKDHLIAGQRHNNIKAGTKSFFCKTCKATIKYTGKVRTWKKV